MPAPQEPRSPRPETEYTWQGDWARPTPPPEQPPRPAPTDRQRRQAARRRREMRRRRRRAAFLGTAAGILVLSGIITLILPKSVKGETEPEAPAVTGTTQLVAPLPYAGTNSSDTSGTVQTLNWGTVGPQQQSADTGYTYTATPQQSVQLGEFGRVSTSWFADAAFLGDSLTAGFCANEYNIDVGGALICGYRSISPNTIVNRTTVTSPDRGEEVALDVLAANQPAEKHGRILFHLALGSLCMAFVAGCRPQMVLFAALCLPIFWQRYIAQKRLRSRAGAGEAAAFLLPVVLVAAGLMWYNYARFGSPFDFGANYNLTGNDMTKRGFNVVRIGPAVFTSLFDLPRLKSVFPFLQETEVTTNAVILTISERFVGGMLAATPFTWVLGLLALPQTRQSLRRRPGAAGFVWLAVAGMVIITVVDCEMAGVLYRYLMDYSPVLLLGAVLCWLLLESVLARRAAAGETLAVTLLPVLRVAMAAAVAWSAVYRFFTLFATQPWLQGLNPSLYFNVARLVQFWM